jgi:hypothetical protein
MPDCGCRVLRECSRCLELSELVLLLHAGVLLVVVLILSGPIVEVGVLPDIDAPDLKRLLCCIGREWSDSPEVLSILAPDDEWPGAIVRVTWIRFPRIPDAVDSAISGPCLELSWISWLSLIDRRVMFHCCWYLMLSWRCLDLALHLLVMVDILHVG